MILAERLKRMCYTAETPPEPVGDVEFIGWDELPYVQNVTSQTITIKPEHQTANYFVFYVMYRTNTVTCDNALLRDVLDAYNAGQKLAVFTATSGTSFTFAFSRSSDRAWVGYAAFKGENVGYLSGGSELDEARDALAPSVRTRNSSGVSLAAMSRVIASAYTIENQISSNAAGGSVTRSTVGLFGNDVDADFHGSGGSGSVKHSLNLYNKKPLNGVSFVGFHEEDPIRTGTSQSITINPEHRHADYVLIFLQTRGVSAVTNATADFIEMIHSGGQYRTELKVYKAKAGIYVHNFEFNANNKAGTIAYIAFSGSDINYSSASSSEKDMRTNEVFATKLTSEEGFNIAIMLKNRSTSVGGDWITAPPAGTELRSRETNKSNQWLTFALATTESANIRGKWGTVNSSYTKEAATMAINLRG